jgi:integrase
MIGRAETNYGTVGVSVRDTLPNMARRRYQASPVKKRCKDVRRPYWQITYRVDATDIEDGKKVTTRPQRKKFLGYAAGPDAITKREAERLRDEFMATINRCEYVIQSQVPFREFLDIYEKQHLPTLAASSRGKYESHLKNHIRPTFGNARLMDIDASRIQMWLLGTDLSYSTKKDLKHLIHGIFKKARKWGYWKEINPAEDVDLGRERVARERRKLTDAEIQSLLDALPADVRAMIRVALFLTLRVSEILGLQEKHLDFENRLVLVRQRFYRGSLDVPKSKKSRRDIPMRLLEPELRARCTGDPERFLFSVTMRGQHKERQCRDDRDINQHILRPIAKKLGLYYKGFGFHHFRHQAVTALNKEDPMQAMKIAGHSRPEMGARYTLEDQERQGDAIQKHQERFIN